MYEALRLFMSQQCPAHPKSQKEGKLNGDEPVLQMLSEPRPWDWRVQNAGTTPSDAYDFFDHMPAALRGKIYLQSAQSFSKNYRAFLRLLDPSTFPDPQALQQGLAANERPVDCSATMPLGWTKVYSIETGLSEARPAWTVPFTPYSWKQNVASRSGAMELDLTGGDAEIALGKDDRVVENAAITKLGFSSSAWGCIPISPCSWFDSSITVLALQGGGPYKVSGWDNEKVFGERGLLASRVAEFIVALNPCAVAEIKNEALGADVAPDSLRLGGVRFTKGSAEPGTISASIVQEVSAETTRLSAVSTDGQAYIIAVYVTSGYNL